MLFLRLLLALFVVSLPPLMEATLGEYGNSFNYKKIKWHPVRYLDHDNDIGFKAIVPVHGLVAKKKEGDVFVFGQANNVAYEVHCSEKGRFEPPASSDDFIKKVEKVFKKDADVILLPGTMKNVHYIADIAYKKGHKRVRIYCSKNQLYWAIIQPLDGKEPEHAEFFFNSIEIMH